MAMKYACALGFAFLFGCNGAPSPGAGPDVPPLHDEAVRVSTRLPVDITWSRIGGKHVAVDDPAEFLDWINSHPRVGGSRFYDVASIKARNVVGNLAAPEPALDWNLPLR